MARRRSRKAVVTLGRAAPESSTVNTTPPPPPTAVPRESASQRLLKPQELAERLGVTRVTVRRMLEAKELPYVPVGKRVRFIYEDVLAHLRKPK